MSTPEVSIRPAERADVPAITKLIAELNFGEGRGESADEGSIAALLFGEDNRVRARALVAWADRRIVGTALVYWGYDTVSASQGYHLADIVVTETQRGQGIGTMLFEKLAAECLREGGKWISLTVLRKNDRGRKFYQSRGMVEMGVDVFAIGPNAMARLTGRGER